MGALGGAQGGQSLGTAVICTNTAPGAQNGIDWVMGGAPPTRVDDQGYGAGFEAGFNSALGGRSTPAGPGAQSAQGFADGYAVGFGLFGLFNTPTTVTNLDGSVTTTTPDGTVTTVMPDGTTTISTMDGTTSKVSPDGTVTTTSADRNTTSTNSPDGTIKTTTDDGTNTTTATTAPDGTTTTKTEGDDPGHPNTGDNFPNPDDYGPNTPRSINAFTASVTCFPVGVGLSSLVTSITAGSLHTYLIAGTPQIVSGGALASAGIIAGMG